MGNINITDKAISKIQEVLSTQKMKYFRIKVKGGGCSGFQYIFKSDNDLNQEKDVIFNFNNLQVIIDKNSMEFIDQSELDYKEEMIGSSFSITNPKAKNSCGCGSSFSI
jgi:iron-sulfur cluster insertion protein